jgi:hypothetical protein
MLQAAKNQIPNKDHQLRKFQIPSIKLQTNTKFQYPMTQTGVTGSFFKTVYIFEILNFGHEQRRRLRRVL